MTGRPVGSKGPKTKAWLKLGDFMLNKGSRRMLDIMRDMSDEDYVKTYFLLAQYFKPKMQATTVKSEGEINVSIVSPDPELMNKI